MDTPVNAPVLHKPRWLRKASAGVVSIFETSGEESALKAHRQECRERADAVLASTDTRRRARNMHENARLENGERSATCPRHSLGGDDDDKCTCRKDFRADTFKSRLEKAGVREILTRLGLAYVEEAPGRFSIVNQTLETADGAMIVKGRLTFTEATSVDARDLSD